MSRLSYSLCVATNLGLGLAIYAYGFMSLPGWDTAAARNNKPQPAASMRPAAPLSRDTVTGSIKPQTNDDLKRQTTGNLKPQATVTQLPKIPGVRFASLGSQALPAPETERWTPVVGYNPVVTPTKQAAPPVVRKPRKVRAYRPYRIPYYARPNFGFAIGVPLRW